MTIGIIGEIKEKRQASNIPKPARWLVDLLSPASNSGVSVTEESAMTNSAVYAAVRIIAETIASLPLNVYREDGDNKQKAKSNYLYPLLHNKPNKIMTSFTWREVMLTHLLLWGNHYSQLELDSSGRIKGIWPLLPGQTQVKERNKKLYYIYNTTSGEQTIFDSSEILHIPGLGFDGLAGKSVIKMAREAIGLGLSAEEFGARFFSQGANLGGIITYPEAMSDPAYERYKKDVREKYKGLGNAHKIMVLEQGMEYKQTGIPPDDAQFLETRKFQISEIARIYRVPPHMLADLDRATFSNIEQQSIDFVVNTIRPWLVRIEQVLNDKLIGDRNNKNYIKFVVEGLLRGDAESRANFYNRMFNIGAMTINEIREKEDMNPLPDGDQSFVPLNMIPLGREDILIDDEEDRVKKKTEQRNIKAIRSAQSRRRITISHESLIRRSANKLVKKEVADVRKKLEKELSERNVGNFERWLDEYYEEFPDLAKKEIRAVIASLATAIAEEAKKDVNIEQLKGLDDFVRNYIESFSIRYSKYSKNQIRALIREATAESESPFDKIEQRLDEWEEKRANKVARRESVKGAGAFSKFVFVIAGITRLIWVTMGSDPCPYCQELSGKVVGIDQNFLNAGDSINPDDEEAEGPMKVGGNIGHAPLHEGCECGISPA